MRPCDAWTYPETFTERLLPGSYKNMHVPMNQAHAASCELPDLEALHWNLWSRDNVSETCMPDRDLLWYMAAVTVPMALQAVT